jgi:hypothetical protein
MDDPDDLGVLAARWRAVCAALALAPDDRGLTAQAQEVGSALLTACRRQGISPTLAFYADGEA